MPDVTFSSELKSKCRAELRRAFHDSNLTLSDSATGGDLKVLALSRTSTSVNYTDLRAKPWTLYPVYSEHLPKQTFWIGIRATFQKTYLKTQGTAHSDYILADSAICLLAGQIEQELLIRCEWHSDQLLEPHAQPHWHIHAPIVQDAKFESFLEASGFQADLDKTLDVKSFWSDSLSRMHFAMASRWHEGIEGLGGVNQTIDSADSLATWLGQVTSYLINQVEYVYGRHGSTIGS